MEEQRIEDYWDAFSKYDDDEMVHVLAEKWGWSVYRVQQWIKDKEDLGWL
jgi:hypothetical protein